MGLKKIFPVIFVLITLSLIGSIYIQVNWIVTMNENKLGELKHKLVDAMRYVSDELVAQRSTTPGKALRLKPTVPFHPSDPFAMEMMRVPGIAESYTPEDIDARLRKAFNIVGLKNTHFEFEISSDLSARQRHAPPR